jgi:lipopolysaccharide transport system ATP-binding protein
MSVIRFDHVSKQFTLHHQRTRSLQELFLNMLRLRRNANREKYWALRDVSFEIEDGVTMGFIGPNGAGKSTALKLISRIIEPTEGKIEVSGRVGALLELGAGFHPDLTGRENIYLNGSILGLRRSQLDRRMGDIIAFAELERFIDVPVKHYSSGMYVRLGFSIAVHTDPEILLVDEVLAVGDTIFQHKCLDKIMELRDSGVVIVMVSHDLSTIQDLCNQAIWFEDGCVRAWGHPTDVVMEYRNSVADEENLAADQSLGRLAEGQRWGSGRLQITRVEMCDRRGTPQSVFTTGSPFEVRIHYHAPSRLEDPIFGIAVHHQNATLISGPNTGFDGIAIPFVEGDGLVTYHIPALSLLEGKYNLSVSAHNRADTEIYDYHDRAYSFRVYRGRSREAYGLTALNGTWQVQTPTIDQISDPVGGSRATEAR